MPLHTLHGGFSPTSKKEQSSEKEPGQKELRPSQYSKYKKAKVHSKNIKSKHTVVTKRGNENKSLHNVPIFSANGAGCISKIQSIVDNINHLRAGIITLQETHFTRKGKLNQKLKDFEFFEAIRKKVKGGTLIGVHKSLDPILIEEYSEEFELLVVEVRIGNKDVRIISGYGPQENWNIEDRMPFFRAIEEEIVKAKMSDK